MHWSCSSEKNDRLGIPVLEKVIKISLLQDVSVVSEQGMLWNGEDNGGDTKKGTTALK